MTKQSDDTELIFLTLQGDTTAFDRLVLRYQPMAIYIANRIVGNKDLAQELVQDALLQAYVSLEKLRDPKCFKSWLCGIVLNVCRSSLRQRKVILFSFETLIFNSDGELLIMNKSSPDPQQVAEREEQYTILLKAIYTLSPKNRSATLLFYHEQLSVKEVANRLNISVNAVKGRLYKARCQLREQLLPQLNQIQHPLQQYKTMTTNTVTLTKTEPCCSFCNKDTKQVEFLIAGPPLPSGNDNVYICVECVDICNSIVSKQRLMNKQSSSSIDSNK